ncbi:MAG: hypothetical protein J6Q20_04550 [Alistipes sp.]|nr:hypothetical protein [Alistipes sp.]
MKRMMKLWTLVAVAAMGFTACQNNFEESATNSPSNSVVVKFISEEARTSVDTSGDAPIFSWSESDTFEVLEQTDALAKATSVNYTMADGKAYIDAEFAANAGKGAYKYIAIHPASGFVSAESIDAVTLALPAEQTMAEESYDANADLMVSLPVTTEAQPTEAQPLRFTRVAAVAKLAIKNLELAADEVVESVEFTADGKTLAGSITANLENPVEDTFAFSVKEGVSTVKVATSSKSDVYFTVLPTTLEAGDAYSVVILTNKHLYIKTGSIPAEKSLAFESGMVTRIGVNMAGIEPSEKWVLVRDASTLEAGDIVTIAAADLNYVMGKMGSQYANASYTEAVKVRDYLYHPVFPAGTTSGDNMIQELTLAGSDKANAFHFYNKLDYSSESSYVGYLCTYSSNNYLKTQAYPTDRSLFDIDIDSESGVASVVASDSDHAYKTLVYRAYNGGATTNNRRFGCTSSVTSEHHNIAIYKVAGKKNDVPVADAVISVPEQVVVPVEGVAELTAFEDVKFTYVGDWAIEVTTEADWLTLSYADGVLKYSAVANPSGVRTAKVTITATHDGKDAQTFEFDVVQKGAPVKVTVAEFLAVATEENVNPNVEYEVTGILSQKPSSAGGTAYLVDDADNKAYFKYVDMTNGTTLASNTNVKVGDVVTIVAAVSAEATGGSSSAHAICKGYYNFSATAANDHIDYTGGSVKLTLTKNGTLNPVGDITCKANADFAEVAYTTNANEATVTLPANDGAPRQVVVTFTDGYASASVAIVQGADQAKGNTWKLVTDASTLAVGDQVIVAAANYDVAMSTTISSSENRPAVEIAKLGNYYLTPTETTQTLVLGKGSVDGTFAFYDSVNEGYLVSSSTSSSTYKLKTQTFINENTSFVISIADGVATIGNKQGTYSSCKFGYRASSYKYFFSGTSTSQETVCLYRLEGVKGSIPVAPADVTVPTNSVVVPEEGAATATAIADVKFNYVGDWEISATSEAEWISFAFDKANNKLTYTALENKGTVREIAVTITASMEGQESKSWTFNVLQKGAPVEISIADFKNKEVNTNITYKLTGVITVAATSESGYYTISDGNDNTAEVRYVKTEDGVKVPGNNEIGLKVGDVITVTTVVTNSKGKGGSSTYPTIYKGHYRLTASASTSLVGYAGGQVTITLATEGNLKPEDAVIEGAPAKTYDFVTFNHTTNATTATATFAANAGAPRNAAFNFKYGMAQASVAIGQENHPDVKVGWYLVEDVNDLQIGDKVIIAGKNPDGTLDYSIKTWTSTNSNPTSMPIDVVGNYIPDATGIQQFTLASGAEAYPGTFAFVFSTDKHLYNSSGNLRGNSTLNEYSSWSVTIDAANNGAATLKCSKAYSSKDTIALNWTESNQTFSLYAPGTTGKGAIYIYKYYNE